MWWIILGLTVAAVAYFYWRSTLPKNYVLKAETGKLGLTLSPPPPAAPKKPFWQRVAEILTYDDPEAVALEQTLAAIPLALTPMPSYHWKDGWQFQRQEDGTIHIWNDAKNIILDIPPAEWASINSIVTVKVNDATGS